MYKIETGNKVLVWNPIPVSNRCKMSCKDFSNGKKWYPASAQSILNLITKIQIIFTKIVARISWRSLISDKIVFKNIPPNLPILPKQ